MTGMIRPWLSAVASLALLVGAGACNRDDRGGASTDTTARDLTLAPAESTVTPQLRDVPPPPPASTPQTRPQPQQTTRRAAPPPAPPAAPRPTMLRLAAGTRFDMAATDTISSRTAKAGDTFTARLVEDVRNPAGVVVIPAGSVVNGTITEVKPAPNPRTPGTLTLAVNSVTVRGTSYPIAASIDSVETTHQGRGVTTGDVAKVGAGAVAGAVIGRVVGGNRKGTIIGGVVGGIAGAGAAVESKDSDIVLPAGAHIIVSLTQELAVRGQ